MTAGQFPLRIFSQPQSAFELKPISREFFGYPSQHQCMYVHSLPVTILSQVNKKVLRATGLSEEILCSHGMQRSQFLVSFSNRQGEIRQK
jgi:hypothetical protein